MGVLLYRREIQEKVSFIMDYMSITKEDSKRQLD
jgi:hypothetical protein